MEGLVSTDIHTPPRVKEPVGICCTAPGLSSVLWDDLEKETEWEEGSRGRDICILTVDSLCGTAEANTIL